MTHIPYSCTRAGASCFPVLGPVIGYYNILEVNHELSSLSPINTFWDLSKTPARVAYSLITLWGTFAAFKGDKKRVKEATEKLAHVQHKIDAEQAISDWRLPIIAKGRTYAFCAIVGNSLSAVTMVGSIAFGILSVGFGTVAALSFTGHAAILSYNLHRYNRTLA